MHLYIQTMDVIFKRDQGSISRSVLNREATGWPIVLSAAAGVETMQPVHKLTRDLPDQFVTTATLVAMLAKAHDDGYSTSS